MDGKTVIQFKPPLQYKHYGEIETYTSIQDGESISVDITMKAEVGVISRNVVI